MLIPRYGQRSLAEVVPSVLHSLGDERFGNHLAFPPVQHAVLVVVDGMGWEQIRQHCDVLPTLGPAIRDQEPVDAAFPTTTPVGLATLALGTNPGAHGFVGATFMVPDVDDTVLAPLHWELEPHPTAVQPEPTLFERATSIEIRRHSPPKYAESGMTRALLRGMVDRDADVFDPSVVKADAGGLDYVYLPKLDRLGHVHGANTAKWLRHLVEIDAMLAALQQRIPSSSAIIITSDHGMVTIPDDHRIDVDIAPFAIDVDVLAGEPRMRHIYTSQPDRVHERWTDHLGERAEVMSRDAAIAAGLFGVVDPALADRIGDVIAIANDDWILASQRVDPRTSALRGLHGGRTPDELLIPALRLVGVA